MSRYTRYSSAALFAIVFFFVSSASAQLTSSPPTLSYASTYIGLTSTAKTITIKNTGTNSVTIDGISSSCAEFKLSSGLAPLTLSPGQTEGYSFYFQPDAAQAFSCSYTITATGAGDVVVPVSGTGLASKAIVSLSPDSLSFLNQTLGTSSNSQTITISNTGTGPIKLNTVEIVPEVFSANAGTLPITINAGSKATITVTYNPEYEVTNLGALELNFDQVPNLVVDLSGNGVAPSGMVFTNSATLPKATQGSAYQVTLLPMNGSAPYTFSLKSGSSLPSGLTLASAGVISGTVSSSAALQKYSFTVNLADSAGHTFSRQLSTTVDKTTGSDCSNIWWDVSGTTTPITPIDDLGTGSYQGEEGGLYPDGSNTRPTGQNSYGVMLGDAIQPLDSTGNPDPNGKYAFLAIGESTALDAFGGGFLPIAQYDPQINSHLVFVDGAQGGGTPKLFAPVNANYWEMILNNYLPDAGVTAQQVVVAWIEDSDGMSTGSFPSDMTQMQSQYEEMMNDLRTLFPNLVMVYFSSRIYAGYSNGVKKIDPEPYAYEAGFAVKNAIADQLNGNANLNYNPSLGPVVAPWMSWGPYYWANGLLARSDGLIWTCQDLQSDGTHPSNSGELKVAGELLNFFKTDDTTTPWFLEP